MRRLLALVALLTASAVPIGARPAGAGDPTAVIEVTTTDDVVDAGDGLTSLREAFAEARGDGTATEIVLSAEVYELVCQGPTNDELWHDGTFALHLTGNGATIDQTCPGASLIDDGGPLLGLQGLTLTGGSDASRAAIQTFVGEFVEVTVEGNDVGGAIRFLGADATSTVTDSLIRDNTMTGVGAAGINSDGDLQLTGTIVSGNTSTACCNSAGGVIGYEIDMIDSTIGPGNEGPTGGVQAWEDLSIRLSTVVGNTSTGNGGGAKAGGTLDVINSAVVANTAVSQSGGLRSSGLMTLDHATVVANGAPEAANMFSTGGMDLRASVVAHPEGGGDNCRITGTFTSHGHNLLDPVEAECTDPSATTDLSGDPVLGPLRDNGPTVETLFPLAGSPLVDAIPPGECTEEGDQRDVARPFGPGCDIGAVEAVYPPHGFSDVGNWVEDTVRWITSTVNDPPLMAGFSNGTFRPAQDITRAQVVRLLHREAGSPDPSGYPDHGFPDVPPWVEDAVRWAAGEDIVTGIQGRFEPDRPVTRAQVVRMKYRLAGSPDVSGLPDHGFPDGQPWFDDALRWAANTDNPLPLITGYADGTFRPTLAITRGQVARMDYRLALTPGAWADPDNAPTTLPFRRPS